MENWFKIEFICTYKLNISPLELDQMEFYRIEYLLKNYEAALDEEEKHYNKQKKEQEKQQYQKPKPSDYKMPSSYGSFKVPKMDIPKMPTPKFK